MKYIYNEKCVSSILLNKNFETVSELWTYQSRFICRDK